MHALMSPDLLGRLLSARTTTQVEAILASLPIVSPDDYQWAVTDSRLNEWKRGMLHWIPVGMDRDNGICIKFVGEPLNPLAERLVNGMQSLIEFARMRELLGNAAAAAPESPSDAVLRYFGLPRIDSMEWLNEEERKAKGALAIEACKNLSLALDYDETSKQFAVTIRDHGMGQLPAMMDKTLLTLGCSDIVDKPYLISGIGEGGSSAFSVSEYSIVVSRRAASIRKPGEDKGAGWSIIRAIQPKGRQDRYYAYLAASEDGAVPRVEAAIADRADFANGVHYCHIKYDFGTAEPTIVGLIYSTLNYILSNPVLPYNLYVLKGEPEPMLGTANRLARRVRQFDSQHTS